MSPATHADCSHPGPECVGNCQKRIAFVTISFSGHRRPAISLASEMVNRGYQVDFLIGAAGVNDQLHAMAAEGTLFKLYPITRGADADGKLDWQKVASSSGRLGGSKLALMKALTERNNPLTAAAGVEHWREMIEILSVSLPDVVVLDHSQKVLQVWAESKGIATVILHTPYFLTGPPTGDACISSEYAQRLEEFMKSNNPFAIGEEAKKQLGIEGGDVKINEGEDGAREALGLSPHTFVFCEPELLHTKHLPSRVHAVGPCFSEKDSAKVDAHLLPWLDAALAARERVLYVAFGTLANGFLNAATVSCLLNAFAGLGDGWQVLWSLPEAQQPLLAQLDRPSDAQARVRVEAFVNQRAVLAHPAVHTFLTHGGQTSVNEGIVASKPLVCLPLFCDQYEMAESIFRHGLGLVFHKDELVAGQDRRLSSIILRMAEEPRFQRTCQRYAHLMRIRGGCARAAAVIESIAYSGADFEELCQGLPAAAASDEALASLPTLLQRRVQGPATSPIKKLAGTAAVHDISLDRVATS